MFHGGVIYLPNLYGGVILLPPNQALLTPPSGVVYHDIQAICSFDGCLQRAFCCLQDAYKLLYVACNDD